MKVESLGVFFTIIDVIWEESRYKNMMLPASSICTFFFWKYLLHIDVIGKQTMSGYSPGSLFRPKVFENSLNCLGFRIISKLLLDGVKETIFENISFWEDYERSEYGYKLSKFVSEWSEFDSERSEFGSEWSKFSSERSEFSSEQSEFGFCYRHSKFSYKQSEFHL